MSLKRTLLTLTAGLLLVGCGDVRQSDGNSEKEDVVAGTYVCEVQCQTGGSITYYSCAYSSMQAESDGQNMCDSSLGTSVPPTCEATGETCYLEPPDYSPDAGEYGYDLDAGEYDYDLDAGEYDYDLDAGTADAAEFDSDAGV